MLPTVPHTGDDLELERSAVPPLDQVHLHQEVEGALRSVLRRAFPHTPGKQQLARYSQRLNFACPYCGDSQTDPRKKRGNLYFERWTYKCFNCGHSTTLQRLLLDHHGELSSEAREQVLHEVHHHEPQPHRHHATEQLISDGKLAAQVLFPLGRLCGQHRLIPVQQDPQLRAYLERRCVDPTHPALYAQQHTGHLWLLNLDLHGQHVLGAQVRTFSERTSARYLTCSWTQLWERAGETPPVTELQLDLWSKAFNVLRVDPSYPVTVFEGPLDALLFPNAIALGGVTNRMVTDLLDVRFLLDNDRAGRTRALELLDQGQKVLAWERLLAQLPPEVKARKPKDWNDVVCACRALGHPDPVALVEQCFVHDTLDGLDL